MADFNNMGEAYEWDSEIEKENEFVFLPDGEYNFRVVAFERARFDGSEKMAACPAAKLVLEVEASAGVATINDRLLLNSKMEWKLSSFFGAIGQKKHGERLKMDWGKVIGSAGRAKIGHRTYNGRDYNEVKEYIYKEDVVPGSAPSGSTYKAGSF